MSRWTVWLVCVVASAAVETSQALFLASRISSLADLATNSGGAAVGLLLHLVISRRGARTAGDRHEGISE
jgi:VanZ family protein